MSIVFKLIKKIIIALFSLLITGVIVFIVARLLSSGDPKSMKTIDVNDRISAAYESEGKKLYMFKQEQQKITSGNNSYGYFSITDYRIIPDANQIQTTFRYNNSTLKSTANDYELEEIPSREENVYDVTLVIAVDLTPDIEEDNSGNDEESVKFIRCHGKTTLADTKNVYNYRKIVFQLDDADVDLSALMEEGLLLAIYADFYYVGDLDYEKTPYGTLCLYDFKSENLVMKLERRDVKALKK